MFKLIDFITKVKTKYTFIIALLGLYSVTIFGKIISDVVITQKFNNSMLGSISISGSLFLVVMNSFLFISLVIITLLLIKRKKTNVFS